MIESVSTQDQYCHFHIGDRSHLIDMAEKNFRQIYKQNIKGDSFTVEIKPISFSKLLKGYILNHTAAAVPGTSILFYIFYDYMIYRYTC